MIELPEKPLLFISYSGADLPKLSELLRALEDRLGRKYNSRYWEKDQAPGEDDWETIFRWIEQADVFILFILAQKDPKTDHHVINAIERSLSVGIETGYALANDVKVIPVVEIDEVKADRLGPVKYKTRILFDPSDTKATLGKLCSSLEKIHEEINIYKKIAHKALTRLRRIIYIFGERYYGYLEPSLLRISEDLIGNDPRVEHQRLVRLKNELAKTGIDFSHEQFYGLHPFKYRNLMAIIHFFKPEFDSFLDRYDGANVLRSLTRDLLKELIEDMEHVLEPILWYEVPYQNGGFPQGIFKPTPTAIQSMKLQHITDENIENVEDAMLKLYDEYRRSYVATDDYFRSLHDNFLSLVNLLIEGKAIRKA